MSCAQVMFASVHLEHDGFYPDHRVGAQGSVPGLKNIVSLPLRYGTGSSDFRTLVATYLLPSVADFKPDLILISAGFDGHRDDVQGNGGGLLLADEDYVGCAFPGSWRCAGVACNGPLLIAVCVFPVSCAPGVDHRGARANCG